MKKLYVFVIVATLLACASIQPAAVTAGDICLRCGRPVSDARLAGEIIDAMRAPFPFRTAGCMAKYIKAHPDKALTAIFVTDQRTGRMLPASDAWFVPTTVATPDGKRSEKDYLAFRARSDAAALQTPNAPLKRWAQVVADATID
jgi:hypothetical protein